MERLASTDPRRIGGYRLLGRLGEGGMGRVYLARSERGRTVAVKVVQAELARQPDFRRRFAQEVNAARRVGGEWTAPVLDADTEAETPWVATGYVAGPSLDRVVDRDYGPLPEHSVRALAAGLVRALAAIHGAGLIHRDLKPSNILITLDGPRVIDFGIARALDTMAETGLTRTGSVIGSPGFMSPEQVRGEPVTPASDVFCLGAVLAYAATGRQPFGTADSGVHALLFRIAEEEPDLTGLDGWLRELVTDCLAKDPARRPTVASLLERTSGDVTYTGAWLPGEVLAQLGRHAVQLLDSEDPTTTGAVSVPRDETAVDADSRATPATPGDAHRAPTAATGGTPPGFGAAQPYPPSGVPTGPYAAWQPSTPARPPYPAATGLVTPVPPRPPARAASPRGRATAACLALAAVLVVSVIEMIRHVAIVGILDGAPSYLPASAAGQDALNQEDLSHLMSPVRAWLNLVTIVLWLLWFARVRENAEAFSPGRVRQSVGMAVGCWFIPFVNLFMPKQIANDVWAASDRTAPQPTFPGHRPGGAPALLNAWWTCWVIHLVLMMLTLVDDPWYEQEVELAQGSAALMALHHLVTVPTAVLAIAVVNRLTRHQEERLVVRS